MRGKTVIVTGGSRGIGRQICVDMAKLGANVVINYAGNDKAAEETKAMCKEFTDNVLVLKGDVSNVNDAENLVKQTIDTFGAVDVLVNNAGITRDNLLIRMSEEAFDEVIAINLKGSFNMMKAVAKPMMKKRYGRIINISSVVGVTGNAGQMNYAASKAGMIGMTKSMAKELASRNVTVNAVAPGFIETDMTAGLSAETVSKFQIPLGRLGKPEDVANAVCFLASDGASYITGQVLLVDGGMA